MEQDAIIKALAHYPCTLVEVTGGEPLLQPETPQLIAQLLDRNYRVLLETNGSLDCSPVDPRCIKIMDIKCPSSGAAAHNRLENLAFLSERDEIKFVIADRNDYRFAKDMVKTIHARCSVTCIHFSPVHKKLPPATLAQWILEDGLLVRLNLQLHKLLWPNQERGV
jgi:7-carboxy-7-deazaguanine synthase